MRIIKTFLLLFFIILFTACSSKTFSKDQMKKGFDEGTLDAIWFKNLIEKNQLANNIELIDVRTNKEYNKGHLKEAKKNIYAYKLSAKEFYKKLPKNKIIVFTCSAGTRSTEAWAKLRNASYDVSKIFIFDAQVKCIGNKCVIKENDPFE